ASVVVIVLGTFRMAMTLLDTGSAPELPAIENSADQVAPAKAPPESNAKPAMQAPAPVAPSLITPTPIGRQSNNSSAPNTLDGAQIAIPQNAPLPIDTSDTTAAIPKAPASGTTIVIP